MRLGKGGSKATPENLVKLLEILTQDSNLGLE